MHPTKFQHIWPSGFRGDDFKKQANQKQELPAVAMEILYRLSSFKGYDFLEIDLAETRIAYGSHVC